MAGRLRAAGRGAVSGAKEGARAGASRGLLAGTFVGAYSNRGVRRTARLGLGSAAVGGVYGATAIGAIRAGQGAIHPHTAFHSTKNRLGAHEF